MVLNIASVPPEVTFPFNSTNGQGVPNVLSPATNDVIASEHLIVLKKMAPSAYDLVTGAR
jgi:hypothetical protein